MKSTKKIESSVVAALVVVLKDCKNLFVSAGSLLKIALAALPKELLASLILLALAVFERQIARGDFDGWIA